MSKDNRENEDMLDEKSIEDAFDNITPEQLNQIYVERDINKRPIWIQMSAAAAGIALLIGAGLFIRSNLVINKGAGDDAAIVAASYSQAPTEQNGDVNEDVEKVTGLSEAPTQSATDAASDKPSSTDTPTDAPSDVYTPDKESFEGWEFRDYCRDDYIVILDKIEGGTYLCIEMQPECGYYRTATIDLAGIDDELEMGQYVKVNDSKCYYKENELEKFDYSSAYLISDDEMWEGINPEEIAEYINRTFIEDRDEEGVICTYGKNAVINKNLTDNVEKIKEMRYENGEEAIIDYNIINYTDVNNNKVYYVYTNYAGMYKQIKAQSLPACVYDSIYKYTEKKVIKDYDGIGSVMICFANSDISNASVDELRELAKDPGKAVVVLDSAKGIEGDKEHSRYETSKEKCVLKIMHINGDGNFTCIAQNYDTKANSIFNTGEAIYLHINGRKIDYDFIYEGDVIAIDMPENVEEIYPLTLTINAYDYEFIESTSFVQKYGAALGEVDDATKLSDAKELGIVAVTGVNEVVNSDKIDSLMAAQNETIPYGMTIMEKNYEYDKKDGYTKYFDVLYTNGKYIISEDTTNWDYKVENTAGEYEYKYMHVIKDYSGKGSIFAYFSDSKNEVSVEEAKADNSCYVVIDSAAGIAGKN